MTLIKRCQGRRHSTSKKIKIERSQPQLQLWHLQKTFEKEAKNENPSDRIEALRCFGFKSWLKCEAVGVMPWKRDSFSLFSNSHFQFLSHSLSNMFAHALKLSLSLSLLHALWPILPLCLSLYQREPIPENQGTLYFCTHMHTYVHSYTDSHILSDSLTHRTFLSIPPFLSLLFLFYVRILL